MDANNLNAVQHDIDVMLEALDGIVEPRRITVMHSVGEIHITVEVSNFDVAIYDNNPGPDDQNEGK